MKPTDNPNFNPKFVAECEIRRCFQATDTRSNDCKKNVYQQKVGRPPWSAHQCCQPSTGKTLTLCQLSHPSHVETFFSKFHPSNFSMVSFSQVGWPSQPLLVDAKESSALKRDAFKPSVLDSVGKGRIPTNLHQRNLGFRKKNAEIYELHMEVFIWMFLMILWFDVMMIFHTRNLICFK